MRNRARANHYDWFSDALEARGLTMAARLFVAATSLCMSGSVVVLLMGPDGPQTQPGQTMMVLAAAGGVVGTAIWLWRWPTHVQSVVFAIITTASITLACLAYPGSLAALLGCIAFTTITGYVAFFHSTRLLIVVSGVFVVVATWQAIELVVQGHLALAVVDLFLVLQANAAVALAIHAFMKTFKADLMDASLDPLTGLLNRRAFRRQTISLMARSGSRNGYLAVAMLDLDKFKALNDTYGHSAGDQALVSVANVLRANSTRTSVISRCGGEEFLIADLIPSAEAVARFQEICHDVADIPKPVTASIGTACVALASITPDAHEAAVAHLISLADLEMYEAKRNGGHQCRHHGVWPGTRQSCEEHQP